MLALLEHGHAMADLWGNTKSLARMLNEYRILHSAKIPEPKTRKELEYYRSVIEQPALRPDVREIIEKMVIAFGDS